MHEYYRKKRKKLKKQMNRYLVLIKSEIEDRFERSYERLFEEVWDHYEMHMLPNLPYIGGDEISGTRNLTGCTFFISFGVVCLAYGLSLEEWGRLSNENYSRYFERIPKSIRFWIGKFLLRHPNLVIKALKKKDKKNRENAKKNPGSFLTQTMEGTKEFPIIYHNLCCPICTFCKDYGYMEYLPYLCNLDYVSFSSLGVSLYREKTLCSADDLCDFKISTSKAIPPVWPPHMLDPNDPLN